MKIDANDIDKISQLAKLHIEESEKEEVASRITSILDMIDQMQAINTDGVKPMANPLDATQVLRVDEVTESNQREAFQALAPAVEAGLYLVPKVIE